MNFLHTIKNSIYSPVFYQGVLKKTIGKAFGYYFLLALFLSVISSLIFLPGVLSLQKDVPHFINSVINSYPKDLEIKVKNGMVTTNVQEPYIIPIPENDNKSSVINILVIDTKTPFSAAQFERYHTAAWLTKDTLFYRQSEKNQFRAYSLSQIDDFTLNKAFIEMLASRFMPFLNLIVPSLVVLMIIGLFFLSVFRLIQLFVIAFFIWILSRLLKWNFTYGTSYKISLYAITLPLLIDIVIDNTKSYTHFSGFPFLFTIVTLIVVYFNYSQKRTTKKK